ncbi:MAG: hypothetical protein CO133_01730, partial [Candidatus Komeilibacteria bacterium CG_4_9_14_3_um_filter_37_5]
QLLQEIEPRLRSLTRQMKRLADKEELESELQKKQTIYYNFIHRGLASELIQKKKEGQRLLGKKDELELKLTNWQKELEKIEEGMGTGSGFVDLENKYQKHLLEKNKTLSEMSLVQGKIDLQLTTSGQGNVVWLRKKEEDLQSRLVELAQQKNDAQEQLSKTENILQKKLQEQAKVLGEFQNIKDQLVSHKNEWDGEQIHLALEKLANDYAIFLVAIKKIESPNKLAEIQEQADQISQQINFLLKELSKTSKLSATEQQVLEEKMESFLISKDNLVDEINQIRITQGVVRTKKEQAEHNYQLAQEEKNKIDQEIVLQSNVSSGEKKDLLQKQRQELEIKLNEQEAALQIAQEKLAEINARAEGRQANLI